MQAKSRPGWERLTRPPESAKRTSPAQDRLWAPSLTCLPSKCEASLSTPAPTCFRSELCCTKWPLARLPFRGDTSGVIFDGIMNRAPLAPVRLNPDLPPKLEDIINRALEKERDLRYQHASDIKSELLRLKRDLESGKRSAGEESSRTDSALNMERRASSSASGREHSELPGATPAQGRASESGTSGRGSSGKAAAREARTPEGPTSVVPDTPAADSALAAEARPSSAAYPSGSVILPRPLLTRWQVLVPAGVVLLGLAIAGFL